MGETKTNSKGHWQISSHKMDNLFEFKYKYLRKAITNESRSSRAKSLGDPDGPRSDWCRESADNRGPEKKREEQRPNRRSARPCCRINYNVHRMGNFSAELLLLRPNDEPSVSQEWIPATLIVSGGGESFTEAGATTTRPKVSKLAALGRTIYNAWLGFSRYQSRVNLPRINTC